MPTRRHLLTTLAAAGLAPALPAQAFWKDVTELDWADLIPTGSDVTLLEEIRELGVVQHGELSTGFEQVAASGVTEAYNGQEVRLPGFVVPLEFSATGVTQFILAPFVGACIHVPPPPANQLVLVHSAKPYEMSDLFDPVEVTGLFNTAVTSTELAEVGYTIEASKIRRYKA
ncbi:DUF3299 domain-containing protein [Pseudoruegeria sp. SHC-113]|uniref:DUF3299 domain-containing protein n=1 Tax=Pseudoruegeria sp. SHC-113 TaxID=2855439 RepID=UPI0021BB5A3F|nr:DUF3299 domain-containing protein [Pseudoruegeria sp. SHC-113]MCT8162109.1 DUF3299 domain-containing protein [Pseudoruegeria sp. SHC-113]